MEYSAKLHECTFPAGPVVFPGLLVRKLAIVASLLVVLPTVWSTAGMRGANHSSRQPSWMISFTNPSDGSHSGRYDRFARFLAAEGCVIYALNLRGHGQTVGSENLVNQRL